MNLDPSAAARSVREILQGLFAPLPSVVIPHSIRTVYLTDETHRSDGRGARP